MKQERPPQRHASHKCSKSCSQYTNSIEYKAKIGKRRRKEQGGSTRFTSDRIEKHKLVTKVRHGSHPQENCIRMKNGKLLATQASTLLGLTMSCPRRRGSGKGAIVGIWTRNRSPKYFIEASETLRQEGKKAERSVWHILSSPVDPRTHLRNAIVHGVPVLNILKAP